MLIYSVPLPLCLCFFLFSNPPPPPRTTAYISRGETECIQIFHEICVQRSWTDGTLPVHLGIDMRAWKFDQYIELQPSVMDQIWYPKIYFHPLESVEESRENSKVFMSSIGHIKTDVVGRYTFSCPMDLTFFPFDQQACLVRYWNTRLRLHN